MWAATAHDAHLALADAPPDVHHDAVYAGLLQRRKLEVQITGAVGGTAARNPRWSE